MLGGYAWILANGDVEADMIGTGRFVRRTLRAAMLGLAAWLVGGPAVA